MFPDGAQFTGTVEPGCQHKILGAHGQKAARTTRAKPVQPIKERMIVIIK